MLTAFQNRVVSALVLSAALFATMSMTRAEDIRMWKKQHPGSRPPVSVLHANHLSGDGRVMRSGYRL
jgi:hypothetical protein